MITIKPTTKQEIINACKQRHETAKASWKIIQILGENIWMWLTDDQFKIDLEHASRQLKVFDRKLTAYFHDEAFSDRDNTEIYKTLTVRMVENAFDTLDEQARKERLSDWNNVS